MTVLSHRPREWFLRDSWRHHSGVPPEFEPPERGYSIRELSSSEWCPEFERLMRNRLIQGAFRYGRMRDQPRTDRMGSIRKRLGEYDRTGNLEMLVDVANICLVEFVIGDHPGRHWPEPSDHNFHSEVIL